MKNILLRLSIELFGWGSLIAWFSSIWVPDYRWRLFFTGLLLLFLAIINTAVLKEREQKQKGGKNDRNNNKPK